MSRESFFFSHGSLSFRRNSFLIKLCMIFIFIFCVFTTTVKSQSLIERWQLFGRQEFHRNVLSLFNQNFRPYKNLYSRQPMNSNSGRNMADSINGGRNFLINSLGFIFQEPPDTTPTIHNGVTYDFIVIGGGTAGATIAARLSEIEEIKVLLIEAGGNEDPIMDIPALVNFLQFNDLNWDYKTEPSNSYCLGMKNHQCNWPRGRVMGGSSVLNYMIATRGNKKDYDHWAQMGNDGWSWDEVLPYFKKLETIAIPEFHNDTKYHNLDGPVNIDYVPFQSPLAKAFIQAGIELGWKNVDYNGEKQTGFSYVQTTTKKGMRESSNKAYLHPTRNRPNLHITKKSLVSRIIIDENSKRAIGVEFIKMERTFHVFARKEIILSAGAIGSPQLLMLSGIGPEKHLREMGIKVMVDSPVGENLMDHISYGGLVFLVNQPVGMRIDDMFNQEFTYLRDFLIDRKGPITMPGVSEALGFVNVDDYQDSNDYPNIELFFNCASIGTVSIFRDNVGLDEEFWRKNFANINANYSWTIMPMLMRPKSRGKILLRDSDVYSKPKIIANYMNDPEDVRILVKGIRLAIKVAQTRAMREFGSVLHSTPLSGCENFYYDSDDYWECAVRNFPMTIYHYSGTCKMAPEDDPTAVVDPRLQPFQDCPSQKSLILFLGTPLWA